MESRRGSRMRGGLATAAANMNKSPTRNKSPGRKSPSRKSPSRKSPSRKSPSRKSPSRKVEPVKESKDAAAIKGRRPRAKVVLHQIKSESPKSELRKVSLSPIKRESGRFVEKTKSVTTTSSTSVKVSKTSNESDDEVKMLNAEKIAKLKLASMKFTPTPSEASRHSMSRSISRSISIVDEQDYSDRETEPIHDEGRSKYNYRSESKVPTISVWVGFGVFLAILGISGLGFYLQFACSREECNFSTLRLNKLRLLPTFFNWESYVAYISYIWAMIVLSPLPVGRAITSRNEKQSLYRFNGFAIAIIIGCAICLEEYFKYPVIQFIYGNYQQLCFVSIVHALVLAWWRYIINRNAASIDCNPYAQSGSFWKDYFVGREINPKWFNIFDIKLVHFRASVIGTLLFNSIFIYRNLKFAAFPTENGTVTLTSYEKILFTIENVKYDPISLLLACLVFVHALDILVFEHHLFSSFHLQAEGVGAFLLLRNALFPFLNSLIAKYALEHKITGMPNWAIGLTIFIFLFGWFLKRASNKIKFEFRTNPSHEKFNHADTIATFQLRRLLISSYWSLVRQPNYTGEIISYLSLMIPLIWRFSWPPCIAILMIVVHLVLRSKQVSIRNFNRYNSAWTRYCQRVKYLLIPKVF